MFIKQITKGTRKEDRKKLLAVLQVAQSLRADKETMAHLLEQEKIHHEARSLESQRKEYIFYFFGFRRFILSIFTLYLIKIE